MYTLLPKRANMTNRKHLLTDSQMAQFIAHGYVTVTPSLPPEVHSEIFAQHEEVFAKEGNPGNNLLPRMPLVLDVFTNEVVDGALRSVIGDNYYLQPHRHSHCRPAGSEGQNMHRDGGHRWSHRTRYLLVFYYPQDTPVDRGPSGIVPGSHYFCTEEGARITEELPHVCPAGSVTVVNYDLWHRGMPNLTEQNRYMVKFLFSRMSEPTAPSWNNESRDWPGCPPALEGDDDDLQNMYAHVWHWHRGDPINGINHSSNGHSPEQLAQHLDSEHEREAIEAAYKLAALGKEALPLVAKKLENTSESIRRHAAYTLSAIGESAVPILIDLLTHTNAATRAITAEILGDIGLPAAPSVKALIAAATDPETEVRRHACNALGTVCQTSSTAVPALIKALTDIDDSVRRAAVFSLALLAPYATDATEALVQVLDDRDRYVRGDALYALERIGTTKAKDALIRHLKPARWCPLTTQESQF